MIQSRDDSKDKEWLEIAQNHSAGDSGENQKGADAGNDTEIKVNGSGKNTEEHDGNSEKDFSSRVEPVAKRIGGAVLA